MVQHNQNLQLITTNLRNWRQPHWRWSSRGINWPKTRRHNFSDQLSRRNLRNSKQMCSFRLWSQERTTSWGQTYLSPPQRCILNQKWRSRTRSSLQWAKNIQSRKSRWNDPHPSTQKQLEQLSRIQRTGQVKYWARQKNSDHRSRSSWSLSSINSQENRLQRIHLSGHKRRRYSLWQNPFEQISRS